MNVRQEIAQHASETDKPILLWLFERNHMASEWRVVARRTFKRYGAESYASHRVWKPTHAGYTSYFMPHIVQALADVLEQGTEIQVETGIGMCPETSPAAKHAAALLEQYRKLQS